MRWSTAARAQLARIVSAAAKRARAQRELPNIGHISSPRHDG